MTFGIFDGHCDTLTTLKDGENLADAERQFNLKQAEAFPYFTQVVAVWVDAAREDVDRKVERFIGKFYEELAKNPSVKQIKTRQDMELSLIHIYPGFGRQGIAQQERHHTGQTGRHSDRHS